MTYRLSKRWHLPVSSLRTALPEAVPFMHGFYPRRRFRRRLSKAPPLDTHGTIDSLCRVTAVPPGRRIASTYAPLPDFGVLITWLTFHAPCNQHGIRSPSRVITDCRPLPGVARGQDPKLWRAYFPLCSDFGRWNLQVPPYRLPKPCCC